MAKITGKIKAIGQKLKKLSTGASKALTRSVRLTTLKAGAVKPAVKRKKLVSKRVVNGFPAVAGSRLLLEKPFTTLSPPALGAQEAKYFTHPENRIAAKIAPARLIPVSPERNDLPQKYDKDVIVLQVRDPWWLHTYWDVCSGTWQRLKNEFGRFLDTAKKVLRAYDVSYISFNGSNAHRYFDIELTHNADNWYIDTDGPGRSWCVDFGLRLSDGRFITVLRSNVVTTPLDGPSWITDEEWTIPEDLFVRLYSRASGLGGGSPVKLKKPWLEWKNRGISSGGISSGAFSPSKKKREAKRKFWLTVNTELIVYGATEPDSEVTVCGSPIALRPDGTFSLRFALPDGKQVIPVKGVSCDGLDERIITPIVAKETK